MLIATVFALGMVLGLLIGFISFTLLYAFLG
jgi:hypothetical protein